MGQRKNRAEKLNIGIIPDGNRRWAKKKKISPWRGHRAGLDTFLKEVFPACTDDPDIETVVAWGFADKNWKRSSEEINMLFLIVQRMLKIWKRDLLEKGIRFQWAGRRDRLDNNPKQQQRIKRGKSTLQSDLEELERMTSDHTNLTAILAFDYGGEDEIIRTLAMMMPGAIDHFLSIREQLRSVSQRESESLDLIDEHSAIIREMLFQNFDIPELDLVIRTGKEQRLSGFAPMQISQAEIRFVDCFWPDFTRERFEQIIADFKSTDRRFGK